MIIPKNLTNKKYIKSINNFYFFLYKSCFVELFHMKFSEDKFWNIEYKENILNTLIFQIKI